MIAGATPAQFDETASAQSIRGQWVQLGGAESQRVMIRTLAIAGAKPLSNLMLDGVRIASRWLADGDEAVDAVGDEVRHLVPQA